MSLARTTQSLVAMIDGEDLVICAVRGSGWTIEAGKPIRITRFLSRPPDEIRASTQGLPEQCAGILVCPSAWCGLRPVGISCRDWHRARDRIAESIEGLFPLSRDDAALGFVQKGAPGEEQGYIVACAASRLREWTGALQTALGIDEIRVLSGHMCAIGLGLHGFAESRVADEGFEGERVHHVLRYGLVQDLDLPGAPEPADAAIACIVGDEPPSDDHFRSLALGAGAACRIGRHLIEPLAGPRLAPSRRWLIPAALGAAAVLVFVLSGWLWHWRLDRATEDNARRSAALQQQSSEAERAREEAASMAARLQRVRSLAESWQPLAPDVVDALRAVPDDAFLYAILVDRDELKIEGEASSVADVLRSLESNSRFSDPRRDISRPVGDRVTFEISAARAAAFAGEGS